MLKKYYQFAHIPIEIRMPDLFPVPEHMKLFETEACEEEKMQRIYELSVVDDPMTGAEEFYIRYPNARQIFRRNMQIFRTPVKECRILRMEETQPPYAVYTEEDPKLVRVRIRKDIPELLKLDTVFCSLLGLEKVMLERDALILHAAHLCRKDKAILFSAPSRTGKSTQAALWERYRGAVQVNGDRALLTGERDEWYAYGWPVCGSSGICKREAYPVQAIVMLYQSETNQIRRLNKAEAVKKILSQTTINMWNEEFQMRALDLLEGLAEKVPVYELGCNQTEDAVSCLEKEL